MTENERSELVPSGFVQSEQEIIEKTKLYVAGQKQNMTGFIEAFLKL
jgi:hypothetical protein